MVEAEAASSTSSVYAVMASWLTPSCLFIFINLVIGTIAVTSRFTTQKKHHHHHQQQSGDDSPGQLARSPSLLDRVMSSNLGYYKYKHQPPAETETESALVTGSVQNGSPRLVRSGSLLERVKSFIKTEDPNPGDPTREEGMTRAPSLLERFKSMKFSRSGSINEEKEAPGSGPGPEPESDVSGNGSGQGNLVEGRGRYSRKWEGEEEEEEVDKKADDFINRFKQQLRMQRLDSLLRSRDMLKGD